MEIDRLELLRKIEAGEVSPEEGLRLLNVVDGDAPEMLERMEINRISAPAVEVLQPAPSSQNVHPKSDIPDFSKFRILSWVMFGAFLILTLVSANWMIQGWLTKNFGWGFWLSWIPFAVGILGIATSLNSHWLHLRVREGGNGNQKNIRISMPLPLGLASWVLMPSLAGCLRKCAKNISVRH